MNKQTALLGIFLSFVLFGCSTSSDVPDVYRINGTWQWQMSTGGIGGWTIQRGDPGVPDRTLIFRPDMTFEYYRDHTLFASGRYFITIDSGSPLLTYQPEQSQNMMPQYIRLDGDNELQLIDTCYDCYIDSYQRVPDQE